MKQRIHQEFLGRIAKKRQRACQHLKEKDAKRVDIRLGSDGLVLGYLFGGHISGGSADHPGDGQVCVKLVVLHLKASGAEVADLDHDLLGGMALEHDVGGFEIAVDDAEVMGFFKGIADLQGDLQGDLWREGALGGKQLTKRLPFDQFHDKEDTVSGGDTKLVKFDSAGMLEPQTGLSFSTKTADGLGLCGEFGLEQLEGDLLAGGKMTRPKYSPCRAFGEVFFEVVGVDDLTKESALALRQRCATMTANRRTQNLVFAISTNDTLHRCSPSDDRRKSSAKSVLL